MAASTDFSDLSSERLKALMGLSDEYWNRTTERHRQQYALVRPGPNATYSVDIEIARIDDFLKSQDNALRGVGGHLELVPDYQRGHVWSDEQRTRYIESVMRGQAPTRLLFNCPRYVGGSATGGGDISANVMQCIDGLQRMTALTGWARGEVTAFGGRTIADFNGGPFDARRYRIQFVVYQFEFKRDLLQFYLDLNGGGVVHAPEELDRVRALRDATTVPGRIAQTDLSAELLREGGPGRLPGLVGAPAATLRDGVLARGAAISSPSTLGPRIAQARPAEEAPTPPIPQRPRNRG